MTEPTEDLPLDDDGTEELSQEDILAGKPLDDEGAADDGETGDDPDGGEEDAVAEVDTATEPEAVAEEQQEAAEQPQPAEPVAADPGRHRPTWVEPIKYDDGTPAPIGAVEARVKQLRGELDGFDDEIDDITSRGVSGDLTAEEVRAQHREVRGKIKAHRATIEVLSEHISEVRYANRANATAYAAARADFFRTSAGKAIESDADYTALLDMAIARISASEAAAGKSYSWLVDTAGAQVAKKLKLDEDVQKPSAEKPVLRAVGTKKPIPQTLGGLPAAARNGTSGSEFAAIDAERDPMKRAEMVERLSEAKRDRYLRRA